MMKALSQTHFGVEPQWEKAVVDFELALGNALTATFPSLRLLGCLFHYCQAIMRYAFCKCGLKNLYFRNQTYKLIVRSFLALPYLPADKIVEARGALLQHLSVHHPDEMQREGIQMLVDYHTRQWTNNVEVYATSVYGPAETTNNHMEASHKRRREIIGTHRPLYEFMTTSGRSLYAYAHIYTHILTLKYMLKLTLIYTLIYLRSYKRSYTFTYTHTYTPATAAATATATDTATATATDTDTDADCYRYCY